MLRAQIKFGPFTLGTMPHVVGTVSKPDTRIVAGDCDVVELRLDLAPLRPVDVPSIATIRLANEGGQWNKPDADRLPLFETALRQCTAADIELRSVILDKVSELACRHQKALIVSYHDFEKTPPLSELRQVMTKAANYGTVVKIATMTRTEDDLQTLRDVLKENCSAAVCVLGMGPLAARSREELPKLGSCLVYGYLDEPVAPGQPAARDLMQQIRQKS